jgi:hypothetical protein
MHREHGFSPEVDALVTMAAEGYAFPANLDVTPPVGGMAPASQADLLRDALAEGWSTDRVAEALARQLADRRA